MQLLCLLSSQAELLHTPPDSTPSKLAVTSNFSPFALSCRPLGHGGEHLHSSSMGVCRVKCLFCMAVMQQVNAQAEEPKLSCEQSRCRAAGPRSSAVQTCMGSNTNMHGVLLGLQITPPTSTQLDPPAAV
jgi:hypothetical protein